MANIIDGKSIAFKIREKLKDKVLTLKNRGVSPKLSVVLVGDDSASQVYVRNKEKACEEIGIISETHRIPSNIGQESLIALVKKLNGDDSVHGILVQLPLPKGLDEKKVLSYISTEKDADGFHTENLGKLLKGEKPSFLPCTPSGIIQLLLSTGVKIEGKEAVVVGRSNIVGKPIAILLLNANATVTLCHSKTKHLAEVVKRGDIVIAAVGKPKVVTGDMIKPGAIVIDVGVNRGEEGLVGDVDFDAVKEKASFISPVPGGVGPMTIAMLLSSVVEAAEGSLRR